MTCEKVWDITPARGWVVVAQPCAVLVVLLEPLVHCLVRYQLPPPARRLAQEMSLTPPFSQVAAPMKS